MGEYFFRVPVPGDQTIDELELLFPTFWNEYRRPHVKMTTDGEFVSARVDLPDDGLIRYAYSVPSFGWERRELYAPDHEPNRMLLADHSITEVTDEIYSFGGSASDRVAPL